jgi:hypothetical protein
VAVIHVPSPGNEESTAVSKLQSIDAPRGSNSRRVGSTRALTAGVVALVSCCENEAPPVPEAELGADKALAAVIASNTTGS